MNNITKVSEITATDLAEYLRLDEVSQTETITLNNLLGIAKSYISSYTGRTIEELDDYQDFVIVALVLVQDMWDNRTLYPERSNLNNVVETIMSLHSVNLLPSVEES